MFPQTVMNGLTAGCVYALFALGFGLSYRITGFFSFSFGGIYALAAYSFYALTAWGGLSPWLAFLVAVAGAAAIGAGLEEVLYQPMRAQRVTSSGLLIASLGVLIAIQNIIALLFGDAALTIRTDAMSEAITAAGVRLTHVQLYVILVTSVSYLFIQVILRATHWGRLVRALANDALLSRIVGIPTRRIRIQALGLASALGGLAAILTGFDTDLTPGMGFRALLLGVVATVVGGAGSLPGSLLGGLLVGLIQHLGAWFLSTQWQDALIFGLLICFLLWWPRGLLGATTETRGV